MNYARTLLLPALIELNVEAVDLEDVLSEDIFWIRNEINRSFFAGKKILVSGGAGFIGSYLCEAMTDDETQVTCLDNFSTGMARNLNNLIGKGNFKLIRKDSSSFEGIEKYDYVFHLASRASPEEYGQHPVDTLLANSVGSLKLLELARKSDAIILFASTSEIYGDAKVVPTPESYWGNVNPIGPRSCYDEAKRFGEALFTAYRGEYGLDTRIVRIHNTYGPRLRGDGIYARALARFIFQALEGNRITIYGDGKQTRSFCYITDTVRALIKMVETEKAKGEVINIGSPVETTIFELAQKVLELTNSNSEITFCALPEDDPTRRCPNIKKAKDVLNWIPKIDLDQGLRRTIKWFKTSRDTVK